MEATSTRDRKRNELDSEDLFTYKSGNILKTICSTTSVVFYQQDGAPTQTQDVPGSSAKWKHKRKRRGAEQACLTSPGPHSMDPKKDLSYSPRQLQESKAFRHSTVHYSSKPRTTTPNKIYHFTDKNFSTLASTFTSPKLQNEVVRQPFTKKNNKDFVLRKDYRNVIPNSRVIFLLTDSNGQCLLAASTKRKKKHKLDNSHSETDHRSHGVVDKQLIATTTSEYDAKNTNKTTEVVGKTMKYEHSVTNTFEEFICKEKYISTINVSTQTVKKKRKINVITAVEQFRKQKETNLKTRLLHSNDQCNNTKSAASNLLKGTRENSNLNAVTSCRNKTNDSSMGQSHRRQINQIKQSQDEVSTPNDSNILKEVNYFENGENLEVGNYKTVNYRSTKKYKHEQDAKEQFSTPNVNIQIDGDKEFYSVIINRSKSGHEEVEINAVINRIKETEKLKNEMFKDIQLVKCVQHINSTPKIQLNPDSKISEKNELYDENTQDPKYRRTPSAAVNIRALVPLSFGDAGDMTYNNKLKLNIFPPTAYENIQIPKHFRGDDCYAQNPFERDQEIQRLLGIQRHFAPSMSKSPRSWPPKIKYNDKETHTTKKYSASSHRISAEKVREKKPHKSKTLQCHLCCNTRENTTRENKQISGDNKILPVYWFVPKEGNPVHMQKAAQVDCSGVCDHRPILINDIEYQLLKQFVSEKLKTQTDQHLIRKKSSMSSRKWKISKQKVDFENIQPNSKDTVQHSTSCQIIKAVSQDLRKSSSSSLLNIGRSNFIICNTDCTVISLCKSNKTSKSPSSKSKLRPSRPKETRSSMQTNGICPDEVRKIKSSVDTKKTCESTTVSESSSSMMSFNNCSPSVCTLYKVESKNTLFTPNLGTSSFGDIRSVQSDRKIEKPVDKPKTFFKKLTGFLRKKKPANVVGASLKTFDMGDTIKTVPALTTAQTSMNSYYINSCHGEMGMSSSIYDTSASQYSDHTILQTNKPTRRKSFAVRMMYCFPCVSAGTAAHTAYMDHFVEF